MNEAEAAGLVERCRRGDERAFEALFDAYARPVFNVAYRMVGSREDARDLTQTVFLKAYRSLGTFEAGRSFFNWVYRAAINEALNHLEKRRREQDATVSPPAAAAGPEEAASAAERSRILQETLMKLAPDHRVMIVLRHLQGCSYRDIAAILGIPEKTVKSRLFTARQALRGLLSASGLI